MRLDDPDWRADLRRYPTPRPFLKEQSLWAIWVYRFGRRVDRLPRGPRRRLLTTIYWPLCRMVETLIGIDLPKTAVIGPGLRIWHFGNIFIHSDARIGANCTLRHGITIGNRVEGGGAPVIGDNVDLGAYAQVLGDIRIGNDCRIGAMSLVLGDVPDGCTAVGVPARIIHPPADIVIDPENLVEIVNE
jgi:serine O-acetyltransferase